MTVPAPQTDRVHPATAPHDLPLLDTLRAVGAVAVMTTHIGFNAGSYAQHAWFGVFLARMDFGVAIFFVLSGFLLSRGWFRAAARRGNPPRLKNYYLKRAARVLPAFWVVAIFALVVLPENDGASTGVVVRAVSLTDIYTENLFAAGLAQTWSLATELSFYLVLPLLMWALIGRGGGVSSRRVALGLVVMLAISLAWLQFSRDLPFTTVHANYWLPAYLGWFGAGIALAWLYDAPLGRRGRRLRERLRALAQQPGACWAMALGLLLIASTPLAGPTLLVAPTDAQAVTKNLLYLGAATLIVLTGVWPNRTSGYHRALAHPIARRLGLISYSFFLVHMSVLALVMEIGGYRLFGGNFVQLWVLTFVISWAASELVYRVVEEPVQRAVHARTGVRAAKTSRTPSAASTA